MDLPAIGGAHVLAFVLVMARVGGLFVLAPVFSSRLLPLRVKFLAAGAISLALTPIATGGRPIPDDPVMLASLITKEAGIGLAFALAVGVVMAAVPAGAALLDTVVGFSFGAIVDPVTGVQSAPLAQLYSIFAAMIFLLAGGDRVMIGGLAKSYEMVPLGELPSTGALAAMATSGLMSVMVVAIQIVAPVLIAMLVADAAFGLVARAVPQMNVFVVGLPAKIILAFALIAATLPFVSRELQDELTQAVTNGLAALGGG